MRYINIDNVTKDMVIAKTIYDSRNRILLGEGTVINDYFIEKLKDRGLAGIYIEDELAKDIVIEDIVSQELRNEGVEALLKHDIDEAKKVARKIVQQIESYPAVKLEMVDMRSYDDYTYRHSVNVAVISTVVGMNMGMNMNDTEELCIAAILHDIGKLSIDPNILNKKEKLTDEEIKIIRKHPQIGYEKLKGRYDISSKIRMGVLQHHENEDGSGYPNGYEGKAIHSFAKIIHVADVFDALASKRPYKNPMSKADSIEYLMGSCGKYFDIDVVKAFMESVAIYSVGTTVNLSNGESCVVISNDGANTLRPRVRLFDGSEIDLGDLSKYRNITIVLEKKKKK